METRVLESGEKLFIENNYLQSVSPSETLFGFTYFSAMIPPFRPTNMLILGYGNGAISELTKKIWGDVIVTGVDLKAPREVSGNDVVVEMDAKQFIADCDTQYDYIVVDLYNGSEACSFIFEEMFIKKLKYLCGVRLSINLFRQDLEKDIWYWRVFKHELNKDILESGVQVVQYIL